MSNATGRPLKVGLVLLPFEDRRRGYVPRWAELRDIATAPEAVGFDSVWVPDHLLFRDPNEPTVGAWEAWSQLSALAAVTDRVQLGTFVLGVPFRNPALLAKMADTADEISG